MIWGNLIHIKSIVFYLLIFWNFWVKNLFWGFVKYCNYLSSMISMSVPLTFLQVHLLVIQVFEFNIYSL